MHDDIPLTVERATRVLTERIRPAIHTGGVPFEVAVLLTEPESMSAWVST